MFSLTIKSILIDTKGYIEVVSTKVDIYRLWMEIVLLNIN